ncbi:MAG: phytoene/squalene synthase family protein [Planctomycetia bacterium]|nr:phytoene/squalene synthase family protein [Planctomycetia bacterium]
MKTAQLSYEQCEEIAEQSRSNFLAALDSLPDRERLAMTAVYAFMRCADDLADADAPKATRRDRLDDFRRDFLKTLKHGITPVFTNFRNHVNGVLPAVTDTIYHYRIPQEYFCNVLDGVTSDLDKDAYETAEELERYGYQVASSVGLICLHIWGVDPLLITPESDSPVKEAAIACGMALQWTNILRDVREDADMDRVYLPLEGIPREEMLDAILRRDKKFLSPVLRKNLERTRKYYGKASFLMGAIPKKYRRTLWLLVTVYFKLYQKIRRSPEVVLRKRIRLDLFDRLEIYLRSLWV